jgi:hypothetical protein
VEGHGQYQDSLHAPPRLPEQPASLLLSPDGRSIEKPIGLFYDCFSQTPTPSILSRTASSDKSDGYPNSAAVNVAPAISDKIENSNAALIPAFFIEQASCD